MAELKPTIAEILKCSKCGCVVMPDSIKCPRCNSPYDSDGTQETDGNNNWYSLEPKDRKAGTQIVMAHYRFICPRHGKIDIRATMPVATVKCPFC